MAQAEKADLGADYKEAGFGGTLAFGRRPALVIVDFVRAYIEPGSPLYAGCESAFASAKRVLAAARAARIPVIFTGVEYEPGGVNGGVFFRKVGALRVFERGSRLGEYCDGLEPRPGESLLLKQYASAFFGTPLASTLTALGVDTVIITGVSTSGCVRATALDACQHGFIPYVVRDAVGDRDPRPHEANLFDLQAKYAEVVSEADIVARLAALGRA
ncbi:MAG: isochorismatase family protein [Burkholderiales bacterium]|nr:isochorismatase family protein [Burkholderiales bacterium]